MYIYISFIEQTEVISIITFTFYISDLNIFK